MTANEMHVQLMNILQEIKLRQKEIGDQVSDYDSQEQDLLHCLEVERCDAVKLVKISANLKDVRLNRRALKIEYEKLQSLASTLDHNICNNIMQKNLAKFENKTYTYKTDVAERIIGRHKGDTIKPFHQNKK